MTDWNAKVQQLERDIAEAHGAALRMVEKLAEMQDAIKSLLSEGDVHYLVLDGVADAESWLDLTVTAHRPLTIHSFLPHRTTRLELFSVGSFQAGIRVVHSPDQSPMSLAQFSRLEFAELRVSVGASVRLLVRNLAPTPQRFLGRFSTHRDRALT